MNIFYSLLLILLANLCQAQDLPKPAKKWYLGAQLTAQRYAVRYYAVGTNVVPFIPIQLIAGCQISDRIALQTGFVYRYSDSNKFSTRYTNDDGQLWLRSRSASNSWSVPLLARYRLSARPRRALRAELLAGLVYLYSNYYSYQGPLTAEPVVLTSNRISTVQGTVGLGLTRAFGPHFTGNFDLMHNRSFDERTRAAHKAIGTTMLSFYTASLGMRYNFH